MSGERAEKALREWRKQYREATRKEKTALINEVSRVAKYHRKYAATLLKQEPVRVMRRRGNTYGHNVMRVIEYVWERTGYPWSERLKGLLEHWLPHIRKYLPWVTDEILDGVRRISARQIDRRLREKKKGIRRRLYGHTKPGSLLRQQIPIRTDNWDISEPGYAEIDLVAHCGMNSSGTFCYSLNLTDIYSGWCETRSVLGKDEVTVGRALHDLRKELPFPLKAIDSDNGSEFINGHLVKYCKHHEIAFTRSRAYKKDDNAHIEQKNWTQVRRVFGYTRYDSVPQAALMNQIYTGPLRLMTNLFLPSVKLIRKERRGSKLYRRYDTPRTPLDRLIAYYGADSLPEEIKELKLLREQIDPFLLSQQIDKKLSQLASLSRSPKLFEPVQDIEQRRSRHVVSR
jgi:hypothetical protein